VEPVHPPVYCGVVRDLQPPNVLGEEVYKIPRSACMADGKAT